MFFFFRQKHFQFGQNRLVRTTITFSTNRKRSEPNWQIFSSGLRRIRSETPRFWSKTHRLFRSEPHWKIFRSPWIRRETHRQIFWPETHFDKFSSQNQLDKFWPGGSLHSNSNLLLLQKWKMSHMVTIQFFSEFSYWGFLWKWQTDPNSKLWKCGWQIANK